MIIVKLLELHLNAHKFLQCIVKMGVVMYEIESMDALENYLEFNVCKDFFRIVG